MLGMRFEIDHVIVYAGFGFEAYELVLIPDGSLGSRCDLFELVVDLCVYALYRPSCPPVWSGRFRVVRRVLLSLR